MAQQKNDSSTPSPIPSVGLVTPLAQEQHELKHAEHLTQILSNQVALIANGEALVPSLARLVMGACELAHVDPSFGFLRLIDPETLMLIRDVGSDGTTSMFVYGATIPTTGQGVTGWVMRKKKRVIIPDVTQEVILPNENEAPRYVEVNPATRSELAVPVLSGNRCWGVLNLESPHVGHFQETLYPLIEALAAQAALTIQYAALQEEIQWLHRVGVTARQVRIDLKALTDIALNTLEGIRASIEILVPSEQEGGLVTLAFATNHQDGILPGVSVAPSPTFVWDTFTCGETMKRSKIKEDDPTARVYGTQAVLVFPLRDQESHVIGILNIESPIEGALNAIEPRLHPFAAEVERRLQAADGAARVSPVDAELHETEFKVMSRLKNRGLLEALKVILRQAVHESQRQDTGKEQEIEAALVRIDHARFILNPGYSYPFPGALSPRSWEIEDDQSVIGEAMRKGRPLFASNIAGALYRPHDPDFACELAIPVQQVIEQDKRTLGILILVSRHPGVLTEELQKPLSRLAKIIASALEEVERVRREEIAREQKQWINEWFTDTRELLAERLESGDLSQRILMTREVLNEVLLKHLRQAMERTHASYGAIGELVIVPGEPKLNWHQARVIVHRVNEPARENLLFLSNEGLSGQAMDSGVIQNVENVKAPGVTFYAVAGENVKSELVIPMFKGKEPFAVFDLEREPKEPPLGKFSDEEVAWAELYANFASYAILSTEADLAQLQMESLRQFEQTVMRQLLNEDPEDEELLRTVAAVALDLTGQPDGYASFWRAEGDVLRRAAYYTKDTDKLKALESSTTSRQISRGSTSVANARRLSGRSNARVARWLRRLINSRHRPAKREPSIPRGSVHPSQITGDRPEQIQPRGIISEADFRQQPILALDVKAPQWTDIFISRWKDTLAELAVPVVDLNQPEGTPRRILGVLNVESPRKGAFETKHVEVLQSLAQIASAALSARLLYRDKLAPLQDDGYL